MEIIENILNYITFFFNGVLSLIIGITTGNPWSIIIYSVFAYAIGTDIFFYFFIYTTYFKNFKRQFPISSKTIEDIYKYKVFYIVWYKKTPKT
jgi:hypothetical protein